jgi:hypothetical protein
MTRKFRLVALILLAASASACWGWYERRPEDNRGNGSQGHQGGDHGHDGGHDGGGHNGGHDDGDRH